MFLPKTGQRGVISFLSLFSVLILIAGAIFLASSIKQKQFDFSKADTGPVPVTRGNAPACDSSKLKMSIDPGNPRVGDSVILNLQDLGQGTTKIQDELTGLECKDLFKLPSTADSWPNVPKYKSCTVKSVDIKWVHKWQNCPPNDITCSNPSSVCSKSLDKNGEEAAPISTSTTDLAKTIKDQFNITMSGFSQQSLSFAYAKFSNVSNTKFAELVKGAVVSAGQATNAGFFGCKNVTVGQYSDQTQFNLVLIHELGHVLYFCDSDPESRKSEHANVWASEKGITNYGTNGCGLSNDPRAEDYAEMITYYLNPGASDKYRAANCSDGRVPSEQKYPLHYQLARKILNK